MPSRRELLSSGLAVSIASAFPVADGFATSALRFPTGIVDATLPGAMRMAEGLGRQSAALHVFAGDPGQVWINVIEPSLRRQPIAIAGFTSAATLFCFQYLSQGYGLALAARAAGAARLDRLRVGEPDLLDLRNRELGDADGAVTWVLTPKRG